MGKNIRLVLLTLFLLGSKSFSQIKVQTNSSLIIKNTSKLISQDNVLIDNTSTLKFDGNGTLLIKNGDLSLNGTFIPSLSTVILYNSVSHDHYLTCSNSNYKTFYNLTITGNSSSIFDLHLLNDINVSNELTISTRKLNLNNFGVDLLTTGNLINETNGNRIYDGNYGSGWLKRTSTIGTNTTANPGNLGLTITTHGNQMGSTVVKRLHYRDDVGGNPSIYKIYDVTPQYNGTNYGGNLNVDLVFNYFPSDIGGDISSSENSLVLYRSGDGGNTWEMKGGTIDIPNKKLNYFGFNQFSQITLAPVSQPLPVELKSFIGNCDEITWETLSELNNDFFTLQFSIDAINWTSIERISGNGTTNFLHKYTYNTNIGKGYYRLLQTDLDGRTKMFNVIYIDCKSDNYLTFYPNPISDVLNISINSKINSVEILTIFDVKGSTIFSQKIELNKGLTNLNINSENWIPGFYIIKLGESNNKTFKIIKK